MGITLVVDLILLVIIVICVLLSAHKGLYRSIMSLVSTVLGIVAAAILSRILAAPACTLVSNYLGDTLAAIMRQATGSVLLSLISIVLFVPLFIILTFVFKAIFASMDDLFKIPFTDTLDKICGGVLGLLEVLLVLWLLVYCVEFFQIDIPTSLYEDSKIISFLVNTDPESLFKLVLGTIND